MKFKNILLYAALLSGMSFSSCTDFLDEDSNPNALSPSIFWKSEGDIMKGLTSVYGALQPNASWAIPFERYIVIDGYRSDECGSLLGFFSRSRSSICLCYFLYDLS